MSACNTCVVEAVCLKNDIRLLLFESLSNFFKRFGVRYNACFVISFCHFVSPTTLPCWLACTLRRRFFFDMLVRGARSVAAGFCCDGARSGLAADNSCDDVWLLLWHGGRRRQRAVSGARALVVGAAPRIFRACCGSRRGRCDERGVRRRETGRAGGHRSARGGAVGASRASRHAAVAPQRAPERCWCLCFFFLLENSDTHAPVVVCGVL